MAIVIDLTHLTESVSLRAPGFESCSVSARNWPFDRPLWSFYRNPGRVNAAAFVDELLAFSVMPRRRPREYATLPAADRARLRRAVVSVSECQRAWRALHGSCLSADERLFAVMLWRWRGQEEERARVRERHRELVRRQEYTAPARRLAPVSVPVMSKTLELAVGALTPSVDVSAMVSPATVEALTRFAGVAVAPGLTPRFDALLAPSVKRLLESMPVIEVPAAFRSTPSALSDPYRILLDPFSGSTSAAAAAETFGSLCWCSCSDA